MSKPNIHLHIERLVLDGLPIERGQGPQLQAAVEAELARLLTAIGLAAPLQSGGALPSVRADAIQLSDHNPRHIGQQIASAVYGGIGNAE